MSVLLREKFIELRKYADLIPVGTTSHGLECPFCSGGGNGDKGFSVTRSDEVTIKYCCHRATCNRAGVIAAWGHRLSNTSAQVPLPPEFTSRVYSGETGSLDREWVSCLFERYGLTVSDTAWAGWRQDLGTGDSVVPILSPLGKTRGYETRIAPWARNTRPNIGRPKTSSYRELDEVWVGWFRRSRAGPVVLVEDTISALKVSRQYQTGCLLGTHLPVEKIREIKEVQGENGEIILALDKDATTKAHNYVKQWGLILGNFRAVELSKDLKYSTDEEIRTILGA